MKTTRYLQRSCLYDGRSIHNCYRIYLEICYFYLTVENICKYKSTFQPIGFHYELFYVSVTRRSDCTIVLTGYKLFETWYEIRRRIAALAINFFTFVNIFLFFCIHIHLSNIKFATCFARISKCALQEAGRLNFIGLPRWFEIFKYLSMTF